jgi:GTPase SAR1 family protein
MAAAVCPTQMERKVVFVGTANVGKSSIAYRLKSNQDETTSEPTIAANFLVIRREQVKLCLWDSR